MQAVYSLPLPASAVLLLPVLFSIEWKSGTSSPSLHPGSALIAAMRKLLKVSVRDGNKMLPQCALRSLPRKVCVSIKKEQAR